MRELQQREASVGGGKKEEGKEKEKKGKWFGKSSSGSSGKKDKEAETRGEGDEVVVEGLRVDQYLVVFLKFMSSIGTSPFSSFRLLSSPWASFLSEIRY